MDQETLTNESVIASNPRSALQPLRQPARLPSEILVQIFLLSLFPLTLSHAPQKTTLALVCRLWNAIVDSTPILWSQISLADRLTYVQKSLLKSAEHPIDLYKEVGGSHTPWRACSLCGGGRCEFLPAVTLHAERWRHVVLEIIIQRPEFTPSITTFSSLRSVELRSSTCKPIQDGYLLLLNGANSPHLREVRLRRTRIRWSRISFPPSLSTLELRDIQDESRSVNILLSILATCPNLKVFRLCEICEWEQREEDDANGHANVPAVVEPAALQELELNRVSVDHMRGLLQQLRIPEQCMVSIRDHVTISSPSTFLLTPVLSSHRGRFQTAKVTLAVLSNTALKLIVVGQRWHIDLELGDVDTVRDAIRDALEWFGISTANSSNALSGSTTVQAGSTTSNRTPVTLKLGKENQATDFDFKQLASVFDLQCISKLEIDGLSVREQAQIFWYLSGPEDPDQPSRANDYYTSDTSRPKMQTTGVWPFPGLCEVVWKGTDAQAICALLDVIKRRSGDGATAGVPGLPARLKRIEFVEGDEPTERGDDYLGVDAPDVERLVLEILDALDDDAELWWRGKRISKA